MCLCFFSDEPHDDDKRGNRTNMFQIGMVDAPKKECPICCAGFCCLPCMNCYMRHKVLDGQMDQYTCCQGYYDCMCFKAGAMGDQGNPCCLFCESVCCLSCSLSSTRMYVMDQYDLASDPCDRRIIRFNNFMQLLACICETLSICYPELRDLTAIIRFIADLVFFTTAGCMHGQVNHELKFRAAGGGGGLRPPVSAIPGAATYDTAPKVEPPMDRPGQEPVVAAVPQQRTFPVTIPEGVVTGTQLQVYAPNGQTMMFAVPPGAMPGQQVLVPY